MKEIKFRAWMKKENKYIYWNEMYGLSIYDKDQVGVHVGIADQCYLDPEDIILEQYTGMKDSDGRYIYEGDTLEIRYNNGKIPMIIDVEWIENMTGFSGKKREYDSTCNYTSLNYSGSVVEGVYIIGHIHN